MDDQGIPEIVQFMNDPFVTLTMCNAVGCNLSDEVVKCCR
ncbi:hypothetical protein SP19_126 [Salmonella phage 19]|nr:hypothetical protein SP19_126 [Salmonella phage 19]